MSAAAVRAQSVIEPRLPAERRYMIPVDSTPLRVFVRHQPPATGSARPLRPPVLFIHGASFPSGLAAAFRFDGVSWMDYMARRGFDVWALDFLGYGGSDRYPQMLGPTGSVAVIGDAPQAARQIAAAVRFIRRQQNAPRVSLVAHSWGTMPAGLFAGEHADLVDRLVLFGPVTPTAERSAPEPLIPYGLVTTEAQRARSTGYVPKGHPAVLDLRHFAAWGPAYLASDSTSRRRTPMSVAVPNGPGVDIGAAEQGRLPYDPARIRAPVLIVRGEWDVVTTDANAAWLFGALVNAAARRDVKIGAGTHVMHLESSRYELYSEVAAFLAADDIAPSRLGSSRAGDQHVP